MKLLEKEEEKGLIGYRKAIQKKLSINSVLKTIQIKGQRKAIRRQIIPGSSCTRKETADIDILIGTRNDDRKIMKNQKKPLG